MADLRDSPESPRKRWRRCTCAAIFVLPIECLYHVAKQLPTHEDAVYFASAHPVFRRAVRELYRTYRARAAAGEKGRLPRYWHKFEGTAPLFGPEHPCLDWTVAVSTFDRCAEAVQHHQLGMECVKPENGALTERRRAWMSDFKGAVVACAARGDTYRFNRIVKDNHVNVPLEAAHAAARGAGDECGGILDHIRRWCSDHGVRDLGRYDSTLEQAVVYWKKGYDMQIFHSERVFMMEGGESWMAPTVDRVVHHAAVHGVTELAHRVTGISDESGRYVALCTAVRHGHLPFLQKFMTYVGTDVHNRPSLGAELIACKNPDLVDWWVHSQVPPFAGMEYPSVTIVMVHFLLTGQFGRAASIIRHRRANGRSGSGFRDNVYWCAGTIGRIDVLAWWHAHVDDLVEQGLHLMGVAIRHDWPRVMRWVVSRGVQPTWGLYVAAFQRPSWLLWLHERVPPASMEPHERRQIVAHAKARANIHALAWLACNGFLAECEGAGFPLQIVRLSLHD